MSYPISYNDYVKASQRYIEEIMIYQWYIPLMLSEIEKGINKLINKIFQENPSLP